MKVVLFVLVIVLGCVSAVLLHENRELSEQIDTQKDKLFHSKSDKEAAESHASFEEALVGGLKISLAESHAANLLAARAASFDSANLSPQFKLFPGHVSGRPATFALRWLTPETVVGVMTRNNQQFALAGSKVGDNQIFASVTFKGRTVAYLKAHRSLDCWSGSMRVEETGSILPIDFQSVGSQVKTVTFANHASQDLNCAIGYLDNEQNSWMTRGYWIIKPGDTALVTLPTLSNTYYFRAWGSGGLLWEGDGMLAIAKNKAFTIRDANSYFPSFAGDAEKLNYEDDSETELVSFRKRSFAEGSSQDNIILTGER